MPYIGRGSDFGVRSRFIYTATAGQTTFSGNDDAGITLAYTDTLYMDVYQNGVLLVPATDYAASTGTSVVLEQGASVGDTVELLVHDIFSVADSVSAKDGGTFSGTIAAAGYSSSTAGTSNYIAGVNAGNSIQAGGNYNVTVGDEAGTAITTGDDNVLLGYAAGDALTTSSRNVAVGYEALSTATAFNENTAVGYRSLKANTDGYSNTAIGVNAMLANTTGNNNVAVGHGSLDANTTATRNTAVGANAAGTNTTGTRNSAVGYDALFSNTTGNYNTAIGDIALRENTTASYNTALGMGALEKATTGGFNVAVGTLALDANTTGADNTAVGHDALTRATTGDNNTAFGAQAGSQITTGEKNVCIGSSSGIQGTDLTTGTQNICIGHDTGVSANGAANQIAIGSGFSAGGDNTASFGYGSVLLTIGLDGSDTSWAASSDERLKTNVATSTAGLSFINDLRPVTYEWKQRKDVPSNMTRFYEEGSTEECLGSGETYHGFLAQEVKTVIDNHSEVKQGSHIWSQHSDGTQQLAEGHLVPMLTKAVQELSEKNDALEARLAALEAK